MLAKVNWKETDSSEHRVIVELIDLRLQPSTSLNRNCRESRLDFASLADKTLSKASGTPSTEAYSATPHLNCNSW